MTTQLSDLSLVGLDFTTSELGKGVYALLANQPPKDNNGIIVGDDAALVVDASVTAAVSERIQQIAAELTDVPVRYLINTPYYGDHTFDGNAEIDLGGRVVQVWQFGPGNGPGDLTVYVPDEGVAWTGNYLCHAGTAPMLLQGGPEPYLVSLRRMRSALPDLYTIVPGHGPVGDGHTAIEWLIDYLEQLRDDVASFKHAGHSMLDTVHRCPSPYSEGLRPDLLDALAKYNGATDSTAGAYLSLCRNLHRLNVLATYLTTTRGTASRKQTKADRKR